VELFFVLVKRLLRVEEKAEPPRRGDAKLGGCVPEKARVLRFDFGAKAYRLP
jgi:hypothetical protein